MGLDAVLNWIVGGVPAAGPRDQDIARQAYVDFLDAQLEGLATPAAEAMRTTLQNNGGGAAGPPDFPTIMGVETRLVGMLPEEDVRLTYWIVRDRFMRVASLAAIAEHDRWAPPELRPLPPQGAATPLVQATAAEAAAMLSAGRTAVDVATAAATVEAARGAATKDQTDAWRAAQKAHRAAVATAATARKRREAIETAAAAPPRSDGAAGDHRPQ